MGMSESVCFNAAHIPVRLKDGAECPLCAPIKEIKKLRAQNEKMRKAIKLLLHELCLPPMAHREIEAAMNLALQALIEGER